MKNYSLENKYTILEDSMTTEAEEASGFATIESLADYRYYDAVKIKNSVHVSLEQLKKGETLLKKNRLQINNVGTGYMSDGYTIAGQIKATGEKWHDKFPVVVGFSKNRIEYMRCGCPDCEDWYYGWNRTKVCDYKAGVIGYLGKYLQEHNIGDATDQTGQMLLSQYYDKRALIGKSGGAETESTQYLTPRLLKKEGKLTLSFKFGESKLFVVKKLEEFCKMVNQGTEGTYGSSTSIIHNLDSFTEQGKKWFRLLQQIIQEEQAVKDKIEDAGYYSGGSEFSIGNSVDLFGWRLDSVYELMKEAPVEYEDWDRAKKWKTTLKCGEKEPRLQVAITTNPNKKGKVFHGIHVTTKIPDLFDGTDSAYYLKDDTLSIVAPELYQRIEPFQKASFEGEAIFDIGRNNLAEFYHRVLPTLDGIADISEENPEWIHSYLLPPAKYSFYLDAEDDSIAAGASVRYGEKEYNLLDYLDFQKAEKIEQFRNISGEQEVVHLLMHYLNSYDPEEQVLHDNEDRDAAYQFLAYGVEALKEIGEVYCTQKFLGLRKIKKVSVSVGVKVSEGMLNLDILTQDMTENELLDILKNYRQKKKYYRLKDGSFVNLEDETLKTLAEMTDVLHLTKEDLKKQQIALPLYRALYLDKLLEQNEALYEDRDRVIRKMASQFKMIGNTEYEVPESLKKTMRSYQKEGYKWLKTLENWGFGGILADEMGLGKTLQAISLILSAKEEGLTGTSLIVSPASLVYNWEEELHRFAPALSVQTVTGTPKERSEIIQNSACDVLVTSYDLLKKDISSYADREFQFEIIDEAQYIKTHTTAAAKAVKVIRSKVRYALTGTPVENRLSELWSIFDYLMPGFLYGYDTFRKEYELPIVKNEDQEAMSRLQRLTGPFIMRRRKEDVLKDLPEKLEEVRYVKMEETQQHLYDGQLVQIKAELSGQSEQEFNQNKIKILAALTRLRQICCDPSLCVENYHGEAAKTEACVELIQGAIEGGHRMLVFSQFTSMLDILQERLKKAGISYYLLTGSTSKETRAELVQKFNEGTVPVFLISLKAGGVGLNLTGADLVIHYDPWWNIAAQNQATDRAHRIGQKKKVTVYKLITKGTIEEKILKLQEKKKALADQILNGENGQLGALSKEELLEILEGR